MNEHGLKFHYQVMEKLKEKYPGLKHQRTPICNSAAPLESDFDTIIKSLIGTNVSAPVIVNCQAKECCEIFMQIF